MHMCMDQLIFLCLRIMHCAEVCAPRLRISIYSTDACSHIAETLCMTSYLRSSVQRNYSPWSGVLEESFLVGGKSHTPREPGPGVSALWRPDAVAFFSPPDKLKKKKKTFGYVTTSRFEFITRVA